MFIGVEQLEIVSSPTAQIISTMEGRFGLGKSDFGGSSYFPPISSYYIACAKFLGVEDASEIFVILILTY